MGLYQYKGLLFDQDYHELPRRKQRGIFKSIERPKGRGIKPKLRNKILPVR
jgi:hypothetical protein